MTPEKQALLRRTGDVGKFLVAWAGPGWITHLRCMERNGHHHVGERVFVAEIDRAGARADPDYDADAGLEVPGRGGTWRSRSTNHPRSGTAGWAPPRAVVGATSGIRTVPSPPASPTTEGPEATECHPPHRTRSPTSKTRNANRPESFTNHYAWQVGSGYCGTSCTGTASGDHRDIQRGRPSCSSARQ